MRLLPMTGRFHKWRRRKKGQTLVEYGIIIALISIVAVLVLQSMGTKVTNLYSTINSRIDQANDQ